MTTFQIFGTVNDSDTHFCEYLAKRISGTSEEDIKVESSILLEIDYLVKLEEMRKVYGGFLFTYNKGHVVLRNKSIVGDIKQLINIAKTEYNIEDAEISNSVIIYRLIREETSKLLAQRKRTIVFFDLMDSSPVKSSELLEFGKIYIELFTELCPKACENFVKLCTGLKYNYTNCPIHRIVKDGWMQTGDIIDGTGKNSIAALDDNGFVQDESFSVDFSAPLGGLVGFSNSGPHSNCSQFFITLASCEWMNCNYVGIGRVVQGYKILKLLNSNEVETSNQKPIRNIIVSTCGVEVE